MRRGGGGEEEVWGSRRWNWNQKEAGGGTEGEEELRRPQPPLAGAASPGQEAKTDRCKQRVGQ